MDHCAPISLGLERWDPHTQLPRHRHRRGYAALVLAGAYEESGSRGRFRVGPGDVLLHDAFDAHLDRFSNRGARVLNLILEGKSPRAIGRVEDADAIVRLAERDARAAGAQLCAQLRPTLRVHLDWPDQLAEALLADPCAGLTQWARGNHLAPATVSRGFSRVFGVTPAQFRAEARVRRALAMIAAGDESLAMLAGSAGFADQAHMSRAVREFTGAPPGYWRRSNRFKTDSACRAPNPAHDPDCP